MHSITMFVWWLHEEDPGGTCRILTYQQLVNNCEKSRQPICFALFCQRQFYSGVDDPLQTYCSLDQSARMIMQARDNILVPLATWMLVMSCFLCLLFFILTFDVWDHILLLKDWDKLPPTQCSTKSPLPDHGSRDGNSLARLCLDPQPWSIYKYERFNLVSVLHMLSCFVLEATHATGCN